VLSFPGLGNSASLKRALDPEVARTKVITCSISRFRLQKAAARCYVEVSGTSCPDSRSFKSTSFPSRRWSQSGSKDEKRSEISGEGGGSNLLTAEKLSRRIGVHSQRRRFGHNNYGRDDRGSVREGLRHRMP